MRRLAPVGTPAYLDSPPSSVRISTLLAEWVPISNNGCWATTDRACCGQRWAPGGAERAAAASLPQLRGSHGDNYVAITLFSID